jgi:phenylalanyl-tRNA synthetase beta chain
LKISFNWLKDYINLSDLTAQEIAAKLTSAGLEVEEIIDYSKIYKNFVVGKVLNVEKHPKADKLSVCQIKAGYKEYRVVCGAPNVRNGMKVALALQGAIIPANGMEIKNATIRGVESFGMLCSEKELNISDDHSGIMQLNDELTDGEDLASALGLNDVVFEIGITPNRPDALSHFGVARELSAILDRDLCFPDVSLIESDSKLFENYAKIVLEDDDCLRYCSRVIINVEVKESPEWLKKRL